MRRACSSWAFNAWSNSATRCANRLAEMGRRVGGGEEQMGVDFTRFGGEGHALLAGEVHHRAVFPQAVHEERARAEIDALHVGAQRGVAERNAEAQPPVLCSEREKVPLERGALSCGELTDDDFGAHACILRRFLLRDDGECLACNF